MDLFELGQTISQARQAHKWTQAELADYAHLSRATVNQLEQGRISDLGVRKLMNLLNVLGLMLTVSEKGALPTLDDLIKERYRDA